MLDVLKSLLMVLLLVPFVTGVILGLIYLLGEFFNLISKRSDKDEQMVTKSK